MRTDKRIDRYIVQSAAFAQAILKHLRKLIHSACPEIEEAFKWNHPCYLYRGKMFCGTGAFKSHATLGFWHQDMGKIMDREIGKTNNARGLMGRLTCLADLPDDQTLLRCLKIAVSLYDTGVPSRSAPKPKPALKTPADLAEALKRNGKAAGTWGKLSASHRREYIDGSLRRNAPKPGRSALPPPWSGSQGGNHSIGNTKNPATRRADDSALQHPDPAVLLRKLQRHDRPRSFLALDADVAAVVADDPLHDHQPETVTTGLGRVIG